MSSPYCNNASFTPLYNKRQNHSSAYFNFYILIQEMGNRN
jgi:hypothetical protein